MKQILFMVFRDGVYRHECCGVYTDPERAKAAAIYFANADTDRHHTYEVIPIPLNERPPFDGEKPPEGVCASQRIYEEKPIFSTSKDDHHK